MTVILQEPIMSTQVGDGLRITRPQKMRGPEFQKWISMTAQAQWNILSSRSRRYLYYNLLRFKNKCFSHGTVFLNLGSFKCMEFWELKSTKSSICQDWETLTQDFWGRGCQPKGLVFSLAFVFSGLHFYCYVFRICEFSMNFRCKSPRIYD